MSRSPFSSSSLPRSGSPARAQKSSVPLQNRSCMLRIGERLMRAGSEGNLVHRAPGLNQDGLNQDGLNQDPLHPSGHKAAKVSLAELYANPELLLQRKYHSSSPPCKQVTAFRSAPNSPSSLPRRQHQGTSRGQQSQASSRGQQSQASSRGQQSQASSRGQQSQASSREPHSQAEIKKQQSQGSSRGQQREPEDHSSDMFLDKLRLVTGLEELMEVKRASRLPPGGFVTEADSAENMTEDDRFNVGFTRGSRGRSSLPLHYSSPIRERALGVVYLQLGEETKQVQVCSDLCSMDALRALFVRAFPHQLTLRLLQSPHTSICIRDSSHSSYRPLEDVRSISPQCCLKVYVRDPGPDLRPGLSTEPRISKELLYGGHSSPLRGLQGSMSPPVVRSSPSSPAKAQASSTLPRQRAQGRKLSSNNSSSSILERRDVLPDEEQCPSLALVLHPDALPRQDSLPPTVPSLPPSVPPSVPSVRGSSRCSAPPSLCVDRQETGTVLPRFHASVKPLHSHTDAAQTDSLSRPKMRQQFGDFPLLGPQSPPGSPQRRRTGAGHIIGGVGLVPPLQDVSALGLNGVPLEAYRGRSLGSTSSNSSVFMDSPLTQNDDVFRSLGHSGSQSERISVMEEQIASLAGLVHRALSVGTEIPEIHDFTSENGPHSLICHKPVNRLAAPRSISNSGLKHRLALAQKSVSDLKLQLEQLRHQQLCHQASAQAMLRTLGQELLGFMRQKLLQTHEAFVGPRAEVERGRREYVSSQESILRQLSELEDFVGSLQRSVRSGPGSVSLRDVELAAVNLRKVGQSMALLKGEFPQLQSRMCSVLRLEVEVVRFLKEEPLKMDSMLSRIRSLTEDLSTLHRSVSESFSQSKDSDQSQSSLPGSPKPLPRSSFKTPQDGSDPGAVLTLSASPNMSRRSTTSTSSTEQNVSTNTEKTRQIPDGRVSPDSNQIKPDQTRTDLNQPESSQSQSDRSLQEQLRSKESPSRDPAPASDKTSAGEEQLKSTQTKEESPKHRHEADPSVFRRPERPSTEKSSKVNTSSPSPQSRSEISSSVTNVKSVEVKDAAGSQVEKVQVTKPPRQPPEVKPKPQKSAALKGNFSSATNTNSQTDERNDTTQDSPTDVTLSPRVSHRKRPSSRSHCEQAGLDVP